MLSYKPAGEFLVDNAVALAQEIAALLAHWSKMRTASPPGEWLAPEQVMWKLISSPSARTSSLNSSRKGSPA